ncbi:Branched-chain amino acid aminotransferase/4-amino-4-deoxychorismate lyase [Streptomyces sp. SceaMP-e96]|uniref:aminotransferase class IV n=1 Tax=Streptomyces TaxID=1883 RepID=UPI000823D512|nr:MULTISPECIES: aminotransferase class IV [unclassified Streptomyces]MYT11090.1 class IV aminotransferase [Streptomyces sp. SID4951]SCK06563.1 Branched-chain amino acid aminotransferase/4-amino-4-deoxychorismate lyase [Streptomyces sp. SceaMP-e96]
MTDSTAPRIEINGRATEADPLLFEMLSGQGHFTAMQVRTGRVRGLDLHLHRLDVATRELFGVGLDGELVRDRIRHALRERSQDAAVRVYVYHPEPGDGPVTVVTVRPPVPEPGTAQRLRSVAYQRPAAHLKHLGGFGQRYHLSRVQQEGFDEALLVAPDGAVAEGAITNIGFVKDGKVIWPDAPALLGTTMLVLRRELDRAGVPWTQRPVHTGDMASFEGAFVSNSQGIAAVSAIDDMRYPADTELVRTVRSLYHAAPWDEI